MGFELQFSGSVTGVQRPGGNGGGFSKYMETTVVYWGHIGIMENKMETTIVDRGYIGDNGE